MIDDTDLQIRCFGVLQVTHRGVVDKLLERSPALRALLGYLILNRGRSLSRSQVAGIFWPESTEEQARRALNNLIWRLRQEGGGRLIERMESTATCLRWQIPAGAFLDLEQFDDLLTRAGHLPRPNQNPANNLVDRGNPVAPERLALLARAAALYRGPLLAECDDEWSRLPRRHYEERRRHLLELLVDGYKAAADLEQALHHGLQLLEAEPFEEWYHESVIRLYLQLQRPQQAVAVYRQYVDCWQNELGLPPNTGLQRLVQQAQTATQVAAAPESNIHALACLLQDTLQAAVQAQPSTPLAQAAVGAGQSLCLSLAGEAEKIGRVADSELAWEIAGQAYQAALAALAALPAAADHLVRRFDLHLLCDAVFDRLAWRRQQADNLDQAFLLAEKLAEPGRQSEIWARRCWLALETFRLDAALAGGRQALLLAGEDQRCQGQALRLLGTTHELLGQYGTAVRHHQQALALDADRPGMLGARELEIWLLVRGAVLFRQTGDLDRARLWADQGWEMSRRCESGRYAIEAAVEQARLAYLSDAAGTAHQWLQEAGAMMADRGLHRYQATTSLLSGLLCLHAGDLELARCHLTTLLAEAHNGREERMQPAAHTLALQIAQRENAPDKVAYHLQQARYALQQRSAQIPDPHVRARFLRATKLRRQLYSEPSLLDDDTLWLVA
jgi:DNA-binding SARP family transcriptional activator